MNFKPHMYKCIDNIRIPFLCTPFWTLLHICINLLSRVSLLVQVIALSLFVNRALLIIQGLESTALIIWPAVTLGITITWGRISETFRQTVECKLDNGLRKKFRTEIILKRARMSYTHVENSETWDLILRVNKEPEQAIIRGLASMEGLGGIAIQYIGLLVMVGVNAWWLSILIFIISIPMIYFTIKGGKAQYDADREVAKLERRYEDLSDVLLCRDCVDERSLFSTINQLSIKWSQFYKKVRKHRLVVEFRWYVKEKLSGIIVSLMTIVIAITLLKYVVDKSLSTGLYIALIQGVAQMITIITDSFTGYINIYTKSIEYLKDITAFFHLNETPDALALPDYSSIVLSTLEFRDVTFCYPGTNKKVLDHMSFTLHAGKHYAVVGMNGSGKTTLTKLITHLYTEYEGEILINGKNIKEYSQSMIKGLVSVLFQDFARYSVSLHDNIAIGDINLMKDENMDERVNMAIRQVGLESMIEGLPQGIHTPLGKLEKDGQDISGGQWQRVAMTRNLLSKATLHILDEPTAALDPMSESAVYHEFDRISKKFTTIFISHRLGSIKLADEILVINQGKVAEQGTHQQLMEMQGIYTKMYESQRSWYQ